ncbi:nicotinamide riboside transporter PnuC [Leuconostoc mesenteroides]|uniref:nicotinamide riboside transporter PnuC n=1 Tax=Leuconostoc mesenteroides TaxID=1245 RepID=UPI001CBE80AB|nr:nicotinamide riboside transporter PnuC [Leuconostoc mesenteroides]MBZ1508247.1 nicotinamide riboside transporter PnuC [Leuconostoc mesenteroides]MBZ1533527.1 nicotinamide mononucleotide transporter [Leuconostoc mesenteroides]
MSSKKITFKDLFSFKWYVHQMSGWTRTSYILLIFGYLVITYSSFFAGSPINHMTWWTFVAAIFGFTTTLAITNARPLNGVFGLLSALIYIAMALQANNPADAVLQAVYIVLLDIPVLIIPGWAIDVEKRIRFIHETDARGEKHGKSFWYPVLIGSAIVAFIAAYLFETQVLHTPRPVADSAVLATGLVGALLTTFRFSEAFAMWLIQGVAQVLLWGLTAVHGDANWVLFLTYMLYVGNDLIGVFQSSWFHHKVYTQEIIQSHVK